MGGALSEDTAEEGGGHNKGAARTAPGQRCWGWGAKPECTALGMCTMCCIVNVSFYECRRMQVCKAGIAQERKIWLTRHGERCAGTARVAHLLPHLFRQQEATLAQIFCFASACMGQTRGKQPQSQV